MLLTAGERVSMALLSMALQKRGVPAISFTGSQSGIITNDSHAGARIVEVRPFRIQDELERGKVVIVAGYQGVSYKREVTTLGRGGSDTTAVALAAALGAEWCEICSDVDGVYSADPRLVDSPPLLPEVTHDEMLTFAEAGAKVLHSAAIEYARSAGITLWARATSSAPEGPGGQGDGTMVRVDAPNEPRKVAGVASREVFLLRLPPVEGHEAVGDLVTALREFGLDSRWLAWPGSGEAWTAIAPVEGLCDASVIGDRLAESFPGVRVEEGLGAVSIVGTGLDSDQTVLSEALDACELAGESPRHIERTSLRLTFVVSVSASADLVRALHDKLLG